MNKRAINKMTRNKITKSKVTKNKMKIGKLLISTLLLTILIGVMKIHPAMAATNWSFVDGNENKGLNFHASKEAEKPKLITYNGYLYVTWAENNEMDKVQIRVKKYNGSTWEFADGGLITGLNYNVSKSASNPIPIVFDGNLCIAWVEDSTVAGKEKAQIRVKKYDGKSWEFIDGNGATGLNYKIENSAESPNLMVYKNNLYVT